MGRLETLVQVPCLRLRRTGCRTLRDRGDGAESGPGVPHNGASGGGSRLAGRVDTGPYSCFRLTGISLYKFTGPPNRSACSGCRRRPGLWCPAPGGGAYSGDALRGHPVRSWDRSMASYARARAGCRGQRAQSRCGGAWRGAFIGPCHSMDLARPSARLVFGGWGVDVRRSRGRQGGLSGVDQAQYVMLVRDMPQDWRFVSGWARLGACPHLQAEFPSLTMEV